MPPNEREIGLRSVAVTNDDHLLVVRAAAAHALVEQRLAAGIVDLGTQPLVLLRAEARLVAVRAP